MLAKVWKKALLAICIVACIYNVMYKLVSRTSLEVQLKSVQNQSSLLDSFKNNVENAEESITETTSSEAENTTVNEKTENTINQNDDNTIVVIY